MPTILQSDDEEDGFGRERHMVVAGYEFIVGSSQSETRALFFHKKYCHRNFLHLTGVFFLR